MTMITMGNDEFILYLRKNNRGNGMTNDVLGKQIWDWIERHIPGSRLVQEDKVCYWGKEGVFIDEYRLPKTAAQFEFDTSYLPQLYAYLNENFPGTTA